MKRPKRASPGMMTCLTGLALLALVTSRSLSDEPPPRAKRLMRPMMGTLVEILWRDPDRGEQPFADVVRGAMNHMESLASRMSLYGADSELVRVNAAAGRMPVKVSEELRRVVEMSLEMSRLTQGAFDITVGSVEAVWGDIQRGSKEKVELPGNDVVRAALGHVGWEGVDVDDQAGTVFLRKGGMRLDLGGIAKGYIVDQGFLWLRNRGLRCFMINAGGDMRVQGSDHDPPWRIGLRDPFDREGLLGAFHVRKGAVVTSGTYERFVDTEEGRLSHILDPHSGRPVSGLVSATVLAREAAYADAMATALMVKGREGALELLGRQKAAQGVLVDENRTVWMDGALQGRFRQGSLPESVTIRFFHLGQG